MRFTTEERADRLVRRRWGFVDRGTFLWAFANLGAGLRDARRAFFGAFGVYRRPDFSWHERWLTRIGVAYFVLAIGIFIAVVLTYGPPWAWPK